MVKNGHKNVSDGAADFERLHGGDAVQKVRKLLKRFRAAMLVTDGGGELHARPMALVGKSEFDGSLWFFTERGSGKIVEAELGQATSLIFQNDRASVYLHLLGHAVEVKDRDVMAQMYTPLLKTWFPEGLDDPELTMLRFTAESGKYWENPGGKIRMLAAFTGALISGEPSQVGREGELEIEAAAGS